MKKILDILSFICFLIRQLLPNMSLPEDLPVVKPKIFLRHFSSLLLGIRRVELQQYGHQHIQKPSGEPRPIDHSIFGCLLNGMCGMCGGRTTLTKHHFMGYVLYLYDMYMCVYIKIYLLSFRMFSPIYSNGHAWGRRHYSQLFRRGRHLHICSLFLDSQMLPDVE